MRVAIDFAAVGGVDPRRLERSLGLSGQRVGSGQYQVSGGRQDHWVDLHDATHPRCDCGDHLWRERVLRAVGDLVADLRERRAA